MDTKDFLECFDLNKPELRDVKRDMDKNDLEKAVVSLLRYMQRRRAPCFSFKGWEKNKLVEEVRERYPEVCENTIDIADKLCNSQFILFNKYPIEYERNIQWNQSPITDKIWDITSCPDLQTFENRDQGEDIRFIWELNRHRHFLDLGKGYWLTDNEKYAQAFFYHIITWIDQNPFPRGINWANFFEISLRCLFWLFSYAFFISFKHLDPSFHVNWLRYIYFHGCALDVHLKASPPSRPHELIAEAALLYLIGALFPEFKRSKEWRDENIQILQGESKTIPFSLKLIMEDSLGGILLSVQFYLMVLIARKANRLYLLPQLTGVAECALEHLMALIKPCGQLPRIGDGHFTSLMRSTLSTESGFSHLFSIGAVLLNRGDFKTIASDFQEEAFWFLGREGTITYRDLVSKSPGFISKDLTEHGYTVMRDQWGREGHYLFIMRGSHPASVSEVKELTHADALSFEVSVFGLPYIVDAGPYADEPGSKWSSYFKHYEAHNSILVDSRGLKELDIEETSRVRFQSEFNRWVSTNRFDFVRGYHTGFQKLSKPVLHHRVIFFKKSDYWVLHDLLTGEGTHLFEQYFHASPTKLGVDFAQKKIRLGQLYDPTLAIIPLQADKMDVTFHAGGETPGDGWITDGYKSTVEAPLIKYSRNSSLPTSFNTILLPQPPAIEAPVFGRQGEIQQGSSIVSIETAVGLEIQMSTGIDYFILSHRGPQRLSFKELTMEGELFFIRKNEQDQIVEVCLHNGSYLSVGDLILFQTTQPVWDFSFTIHGDQLKVWTTKTISVTLFAPDVEQIFVNDRKAKLKKVKSLVIVETPRF